MSEESITNLDGSQGGDATASSTHEAFLRATSDAAFLVAVERTADGYEFTLLEHNDAYRRLTEHTSSHDAARNVIPEPATTQQQSAHHCGRRCVAERTSIRYTAAFGTPSATDRWETTLTPVVEDGAVDHIVGVVDAPTERHREQGQHGGRTPPPEHVSQRLESALDAANAGVWEVDPETRTVYCDDRACSILGLSPASFAGAWTDIVDRVHPGDRDAFETAYDRAIEDGSGYEAEFRLQPDGETVRWVRTHGKPVASSDGDPDRLVGIIRDITERKRREQEINQLRERLALAVEGANISVWDWDIDSDAIDVYNSSATVASHDAGSITIDQKEWERRIHPDDIDGIWETFEDHVAEESEYYETEYRVSTGDGDWRWVRDLGQVIERDEDGEPTRAVGVQLDIDDKKRALMTVEQERDMFTEGPVVLFRWRDEPDWPIEYVSDNVAEVLGYEPGALADGAVGYASMVHEADLDRVRRETATLEETGRISHTPYRVRTADGETRWVLEHTKAIRDDDGSIAHYLGYVVDITERKRREQDLETARNELRRIIDLVPDPIHVRDEDGRFVLANEATAELYGTTPEALTRKTEDDLPFEVQHSSDCTEDVATVIDAGERMEAQQELTTAHGDDKTLELTRIPYETTRADTPTALTYARDVTALKEYERTLERQRDDLETLNQVVRHDVRNSLQLVLAYGEMLEAHVDGDAADFVEHVTEAARDAVHITETARDVTEVLLRSTDELTAVDLDCVLDDQATSIQAGHEHATVGIEGSIPDCAVRADEMLESAVRNLLSNAIQHNDSDHPEVTVSATADDETVELRIADNGPGIPDDRKDRIFQEGEKGLDSDGTGLGLYLVDTLIDRYDGEIRVEDNDPRGAVFVVELQQAD